MRAKVMYLDTLSGYLHSAGKLMEIPKDALRPLGKVREVRYLSGLSGAKPQTVRGLKGEAYRCGVYLVVVQEKGVVAIPLGRRMWEAISLE